MRHVVCGMRHAFGHAACAACGMRHATCVLVRMVCRGALRMLGCGGVLRMLGVVGTFSKFEAPKNQKNKKKTEKTSFKQSKFEAKFEADQLIGGATTN